MKHLTTYKIFESNYDDELLDIFNNIITNTCTESFEFKHGTDNTAHIIWGERMEHDDHQLLKNLYDYREILNKMYNMDYFYVYMDESLVIVLLYDKLTKRGIESYVPHIRLDQVRSANRNLSAVIPNNIFNILYKEQSDWRGYKALQPGIRKTNGDSSNLALFDWMYKEGKILESLNVPLVKSIVSDVMNDFWETGEFEYAVFDINGSEHEEWYRKQYHHDDFIVLNITPDDSMVVSRGFSKDYGFTDKWGEMLIFLSNHLEDNGYTCEVPTHVVNGITQFRSVKGYVNRTKSLKGQGGPTGERFGAPFAIYITKKL